MPLPLLLSLLLPACVSDDATARNVADTPAPAVDLPVRLAEAPAESPRLAVDLGATQVATRLQDGLDASPARRLAVAVDRPLYRPGETVWARVFDLTARTMGAEGAADQATFELLDPRGNVVLSHLRPGGPEGAHASLAIPQGVAGGLYVLRVRAGAHEVERPLVIMGFEAPRIRKELDLLREAYGPGDEVTAALTVASAGAGPLADHPVQILVQVGGQALPRIEARTDLNGEATLKFDLPDDLAVSDVLLTVLVEEGGWQESISRPVPVVLDEVGLEWFPEGGDLVTGLPSRVYLRARNAHGEPADVAGVVVDDEGREVAAFRTVHDGLGRLPLVPQPGRTYTARLTEPSAVAGRTFELPRAKGEGCVLTTYDDLEGRLADLRVGVRCTTPREVVVAGVHRDRVVDTAVVRAGPGDPAVVNLRAGDAAVDRTQGVARVTVLDEALEPIAERLVFRNRGRDLEIQVTPDKTQYGPRDQVVLSVTTRDPDGLPVAADLALSVVDDRLLKLADDEHGNLLTQLYLDPWLSETVEDPAWYLDPEQDDGALGLDLVMGTFGWRRFTRVVQTAEAEPVREAKLKKLPTAWPDAGEDLQIAENAGLVGGLIGARGAGLGGGGVAEGLGGLGTKGIGSGASGYGFGGGPFGARGEGGIATMGGDAIILGALDRDLVQRVIMRHMNQIRYCYQRELTRTPDIEGRLAIKFTIGPDGTVQNATPKTSTLGSEAVERCVVGRFMRMQFPEPAGGGIVIVSYPFVFRVGDDGGWAAPFGGGGPSGPVFATVREFPVPDTRVAVAPAVRSDFRSTVMWAPKVHTGEDGSAEVRFTLSDAVTTFDIVAEGVGGGHGGRVEHELDSTLPFVLDVPIPQQVSFGDRLLLPVRLTSRRDEAVDVALTASIPSLLQVEDGTEQQQIALSAGGAETTVIPLLVPQGRGSADIEISAAAAGLTDAVARTIEVVPRGFPHAWSQSGELEGVIRHTVTLSEAMPGSSAGQLTLYPSALTNLLDGLEDMVQLPGGCFEQTSSSNYPNVLVLHNLDRTGRTPSLRVDRATALRTGYERLVGYQIEAGGFETFGNGPGKEVLSAYGLMQFTDMAEVWPQVDAGMLKRDLDFLYASRDGHGGFANTGRSAHNWGGAPQQVNDAFITWAMVETGHVDLAPELARQAELARTTKDPYLLALAALTLQHTDAAAGSAAVGRLARLQSMEGSFPGADTTVVGSRGANVLVETTAMATLALLRSKTHPAEVRSAARWLSERRTPYGWGSTQATVLALKALDGASAAAASEGDQSGSVEVWVDDEPVGTVTWTGLESKPLTLDLGAVLNEGSHTVELRPHGAPVPYALEATWTRETPSNDPDAPLTLETTLAASTAELGEPVRLTASVTNATEAGVASPIARIGLPAGTRVDTWQLEALRDRGQIAFFETRPREITLYWEGFAPGETRDIALDLIPEVPGTFTAPPSSAYPYYDGEQVVWARGMELEVRP